MIACTARRLPSALDVTGGILAKSEKLKMGGGGLFYSFIFFLNVPISKFNFIPWISVSYKEQTWTHDWLNAVELLSVFFKVHLSDQYSHWGTNCTVTHLLYCDERRGHTQLHIKTLRQISSNIQWGCKYIWRLALLTLCAIICTQALLI